MLALLLMAVVGGFSFDTRVLSDRTKIVHSARSGPHVEWKEHIEAIVPRDPGDADLARVLEAQSRALARDYYAGDTGDEPGSFEKMEVAGSLNVYAMVEAASADLVSVHMGASYSEAGMAHPNSDATVNLIWSRRLHRPLIRADVLPVEPDRTLRRLALAAFDNRESIDEDDFKDGLPLDWRRATIGPAGITWTYGPYELGGYNAGGSATLSWTALAPYLRRPLPFSPTDLRSPVMRAATPNDQLTYTMGGLMSTPTALELDLTTGDFSLREGGQLPHPTVEQTHGRLDPATLANVKSAVVFATSTSLETMSCKRARAKGTIIMPILDSIPHLTITLGAKAHLAPENIGCWSKAANSLVEVLFDAVHQPIGRLMLPTAHFRTSPLNAQTNR